MDFEIEVVTTLVKKIVDNWRLTCWDSTLLSLVRSILKIVATAHHVDCIKNWIDEFQFSFILLQEVCKELYSCMRLPPAHFLMNLLTTYFLCLRVVDKEAFLVMILSLYHFKTWSWDIKIVNHLGRGCRPARLMFFYYLILFVILSSLL